ncbi:class II glutamine amidotransferase [bacterium]|nr:class II glutamine amidotransferase [bacterium]
MCRFLAYKGQPVVMDRLIYQPSNSLVQQSINAHEIEEPLNGDGFGIGWYTHHLDPRPAVFVSVSPAWSNRNLRNIAPRIESHCMFAHVRAASFGETSESNCHPFQFREFMFMHNGSIEGFDRIKREIRHRLSDETYSWVHGQTDSEHFFGLCVDRLRRIPMGKATVATMAIVVQDVIREVKQIKESKGVKDGTWLNMALTDGHSLVAARYVSDPAETPLTLYYSSGSRYVVENGTCRMEHAEAHNAAVLVVSEKLTKTEKDWNLVPANHFVLVSPGGDVDLQKIDA